MLPKAETHLHLEGAIRSNTLYELADLYHEPIPYGSAKELDDALQMKKGDDLGVFLKKVAIARFVFAHPEAIRRVAAETVEDAAKSNVKYMEIQLNPIKPGGLSPSRILEEANRGAREAGNKFGVKVYLIAAINRSYPVEQAWDVARAAAANFKHRGGVVALGLAADEANNPPEKFKEVFQWAKAQGLKVVIHAGEAAGPESIRGAIACGADAIDHGTRLQEDPELENELAEKKIPLRMCGTSNCALSVVPDMKAFPIKKYLNLGIPASLHRDDPEYFGGISLNDEYERVYREDEMTPEQMKEISMNGVRYSFAPETVRRELIKQFEAMADAALAFAGQEPAR